MIVAWFLECVSGLWRWIMGLAPASAADPILQVVPTVQDIITPFATGISSLGAWLPWDDLAVALGITGAFYAVMFTFRVARAIIGHIPIIGGNG